MSTIIGSSRMLVKRTRRKGSYRAGDHNSSGSFYQLLERVEKTGHFKTLAPYVRKILPQRIVCQLWQTYITSDSETLPARVRWISETVQIKEGGRKKRKKERKKRKGMHCTLGNMTVAAGFSSGETTLIFRPVRR